jgi:hypothetical protein
MMNKEMFNALMEQNIILNFHQHSPRFCYTVDRCIVDKVTNLIFWKTVNFNQAEHLQKTQLYKLIITLVTKIRNQAEILRQVLHL